MIAARSGHALLVALTVLCWPAWAGPPYITDDPEPTPFKEFEIYLFASGSDAHDGSEAATGIDFNYGATPDLQLTMVVPVAYENPVGSDSASSLGNIELAAKYRFLHQDQIGWESQYSRATSQPVLRHGWVISTPRFYCPLRTRETLNCG